MNTNTPQADSGVTEEDVEAAFAVMDIDRDHVPTSELRKALEQFAQSRPPIAKDAAPNQATVLKAMLAEGLPVESLASHIDAAENQINRLMSATPAATPAAGAGGEVGANLDEYMRRNYPEAKGETLEARVKDALETMDIALGWADVDAGRITPATEQANLKDWGIDTSTGTPILVHKNCSVIESEQARYVLRLIATEQAAPVSVVGDLERLARAFDDGWHLCTKWANRDDLLADMGSKPYTEGREVCIAAILATKAGPAAGVGG